MRSVPRSAKNRRAVSFPFPGASPDDAPGVVVRHEREVLVVPAVRQLVDADPLEPIEPVVGGQTRDDALDDASHGGPGHAHHARHGRLIGSLRERGDRVLEDLGEARAGYRPWDHLDDDAARPAVDAPQGVLQLDGETAGVEVTPSPHAAVIPGPAFSAGRAEGRALRRGDPDHEARFGEPEPGDARVLQAEQRAQYSGGAHGEWGCCGGVGTPSVPARPCAFYCPLDLPPSASPAVVFPRSPPPMPPLRAHLSRRSDDEQAPATQPPL